MITTTLISIGCITVILVGAWALTKRPAKVKKTQDEMNDHAWFI
jgi:hypothetical protein